MTLVETVNLSGRYKRYNSEFDLKLLKMLDTYHLEPTGDPEDRVDIGLLADAAIADVKETYPDIVQPVKPGSKYARVWVEGLLETVATLAIRRSATGHFLLVGWKADVHHLRVLPGRPRTPNRLDEQMDRLEELLVTLDELLHPQEIS